jgi:hypothetical protein
MDDHDERLLGLVDEPKNGWPCPGYTGPSGSVSFMSMLRARSVPDMPVVRERQKGREYESAGAADDVITFTLSVRALPGWSAINVAVVHWYSPTPVGRHPLPESSICPRQNHRSRPRHSTA